jgi:hypothetical protein
MAEKTVEQLANDFTNPGVNPGGISDAILASAGGGGGTYTPPYSIDPYTSPYIAPRVVVFTINTYASLSRNGVLAKAFLDGVEVENQTISKGRITFTINEQRLLNPSRLTVVSGDLKPQKYFLIQSRKDGENQVSVIEYDNTEVSPVAATPAIPVVIETPVYSGGGGAGGFGGGGGGMREVNPNDFRGAGFGLDGGDATQRQNLQ